MCMKRSLLVLLICISLITDDIEYLLIGYLDIFLCEVSTQVFWQVLIGLLVFFFIFYFLIFCWCIVDLQ